MASPGVDLDMESQTDRVTETQHPTIISPTINTSIPQVPTGIDLQPQVTNANQPNNRNASGQQTAEVQRDENHGDSSDGIWSMYLNEAEKQDKEVAESWKGDTDGILVFTGLFSATVASFIIESYQNLSPDSSDTTNALLTQISQQLVDISNGTPLTSVAAQSSQPFKPTASAVRVNVLWFLSLILSLTCALSATLMQQWARRYQELGQRRVAFHKRGRIRAYIFEGINRFGMTRAVATMPTLLHISVFLFFAGLVEFLFPIYATVAYTTLGCIMLFALAYTILTVLPNIYLNCPYATPLSGFTWRISQFSVIGFLWTILKFEGLFHKSISKLWSLVNQHALEPDGLKRWRESLEKKVDIRRRWFSQGTRKSVELSAYSAGLKVVTSALEWTLAALDEDKEIEDFAARVPGFFDSRVVPDATLAVLPLMSHQPNIDPVFGSRLHDLLETCILETSILDEKMRKNRLRVCMKCLWSFAKAYNKLGSSQLLPSYFLNTFASPEITLRVQAERDSSVRVIGRCFGALIVNRLTAGYTGFIRQEELARLSTILGTRNYDVMLLNHQPGAVALLNMISLMFDEIGGLVIDKVSSGVLDVVQQTLSVLSHTGLSGEHAEVQPDRPISIINGSDGIFERVLVSRILDLLNSCTQVTSHLPEWQRTICLRLCLKGLWYFGREFNQLKSSVPLPSHIRIAFATREIANSIGRSNDLVAQKIHRCVGALVVNKLTGDINARTNPVGIVELECLSATLGITSDDVTLLLRHPGAIELTNILFLSMAGIDSGSASEPLDLPDVIQQTFDVLLQVLPAELNATMRLDRTGTLMNVSDMTLSLTPDLHTCLNSLWNIVRASNERGNSAPLPTYIYGTFANSAMTQRLHEHRDLAVRMIGRCVGALVASKLAADISSRSDPVSDDELACLSTILGTKSDNVVFLLRHPGTIEFTNTFSFVWANIDSFASARVPSPVLDVVQQTFDILSQALPAELNTMLRLDQTDTLVNDSDRIPSLTDEMYRRVLRRWVKNLWYFTREYNNPQGSVSFPSFVRIAFTNPVMTPLSHIHKDADLAVRVMGRCVGALVASKLAADINSRFDPVSDDELACLSAMLGTRSDNVVPLLRYPGAIEFTNMLFLSMADMDTGFARVPSDLPDVVQQTFDILSRALPAELSARMQLDQTDTLVNASDRIPSLTDEMYRRVLRRWVKNLWHFTREYNNPKGSVPLPSYVPIAFTNPVMIPLSHIHKDADLAVRVIGRCIKALIVNNIAADIKSRSVPVSNDELACLSAIFATESRDVRLCLGQPGTIELVNLASLTLGDITSMGFDQLPPGTRLMFQQTLDILSQALPPQRNAEVSLDQMVAEFKLPDDDKFERTTVFRLHLLFKMCIPGASSLTEEVRISCLRMCLKALWHCAKAYHQTSNSLPSYFPLVFASPEVTRHFHTEQDPVSCITGFCFCALIVSKLVDALGSPVSLSGGAPNAELVCISGMLGSELHEGSLSPHQLRVISFRNIVSVISGRTSEGMPVDALNMIQATFSILANRLRDNMFVPVELPKDQRHLLQEIYSKVVNTLGANQLRNETVNTLDRLRQILEKTTSWTNRTIEYDSTTLDFDHQSLLS